MCQSPVQTQNGWKLILQADQARRQRGSRPAATLKHSYKASPLQLCALFCCVGAAWWPGGAGGLPLCGGGVLVLVGCSGFEI